MRTFKSTLMLTSEARERLFDTVSGFDAPSKTAFLDIETTGFSKTYDTIYLIGILTYEQGEFVMTQYLGEDHGDEIRVLSRVLEDLLQFSTLITYNGDMFDLPFIRDRSKQYRLWKEEHQRWEYGLQSLDLFRQFRRFQSFFGWPNLKLKTIEACLGIGRQDPFDGGQLIQVFEEYTRTNDERLEKVLLLHNYEDIQNLLNLMKVEEFHMALKRGKCHEISLEGNRLVVEWDRKLPLSLESFVPLWKVKGEEGVFGRMDFAAGENRFTLRLPRAEESCYYFLPHPEDYFYIPGEGSIVHRSLAEEIPAKERRKAKKEECCLLVYDPLHSSPEEAGLLAVKPLPLDMELKVYQPSLKSKHVYVKETELRSALSHSDEKTLTRFVQEYLDAFMLV